MKFQQLTDAVRITEVMHAAFARYSDDPMPSSALQETAKTIVKNMADGIDIYGTSIDEELVAIVKVEPHDKMYYFSRLSVLPSMQGRGIASALVAHIEAIAAANDAHLMQCKVRKSETKNIALYEKLGYRIVREELTTSPTNFTIETVTMEKKL